MSSLPRPFTHKRDCEGRHHFFISKRGAKHRLSKKDLCKLVQSNGCVKAYIQGLQASGTGAIYTTEPILPRKTWHSPTAGHSEQTHPSLRSSASSSTTKNTSERPTLDVVWCIADENERALDEEHDQFAVVAGYLPDADPRQRWLYNLDVKQLQKEFGSGFIKIRKGLIMVHQSIVTALEVRHRLHQHYLHTQILNWSRNTTKDVSKTPSRLVIMVAINDPLKAWKKYQSLLKSGVANLYPTLTEFRSSSDKTSDIGILDEISEKAPKRYGYRPVTCYGQKRQCLLRDHKKTVHKRPFSSCTQHVVPTMQDVETSRLGCRNALLQPSVDELCARGWFHQEFVPELQLSGEFKVFIATERDETALRGRRGRIIVIGHGRYGWEGSTMQKGYTHILKASSATLEEIGITQDEVESFSLWWFEELRTKDEFLTLEVGCRLDLGYRLTDQGTRLFISEVTRWPEMYMFSQALCAEPKSELCEVFAKSFCEWVVDPVGQNLMSEQLGRQSIFAETGL